MNAIFENTFLIAQVFGLCAMCFSICAWQLKNPRNILKCYIPASLLWAAQYFLLGGYVAVLTCIGAALKDSLLSIIPANKAKYVIFSFLIIMVGIGLFFVKQPIDVLPILTIGIFNLALLQPDNRSLMSRIIILCQFSWFAYNLQMGAWMGVICCVFVMSSSFMGMVRHEQWEIGGSLRSFIPSIRRALFDFTPRTYP